METVTKWQSRSGPGLQSPDSVTGAGGAAFIAHRAGSWKPRFSRPMTSPPPQHRKASLLGPHYVASGFPQKLPKREPGRICGGALSDPDSEATHLPFRQALQGARAAPQKGHWGPFRQPGTQVTRFRLALGSAHLQPRKENDIYICDCKICTINFSQEACDGNWVTES